MYILVVEATEVHPPVTRHHVHVARGQLLPLGTCQARQPEHSSLEHRDIKFLFSELRLDL